MVNLHNSAKEGVDSTDEFSFRSPRDLGRRGGVPLSLGYKNAFFSDAMFREGGVFFGRHKTFWDTFFWWIQKTFSAGIQKNFFRDTKCFLLTKIQKTSPKLKIQKQIQKIKKEEEQELEKAQRFL